MCNLNAFLFTFVGIVLSSTPPPIENIALHADSGLYIFLSGGGGGVVDNTMPTRTKRKALRLHMSQVGLVPVKDTQFKIATAKFVNNEQLPPDWRMVGRKLKLTVDQINEITC